MAVSNELNFGFGGGGLREAIKSIENIRNQIILFNPYQIANILITN